MPDNATERRTNPRFSCTRQFSYFAMGDLLHPPDKVSVQGKILDISSSGMRIKVNTDFHEQNIPYLKRFRKPRIRK